VLQKHEVRKEEYAQAEAARQAEVAALQAKIVAAEETCRQQEAKVAATQAETQSVKVQSDDFLPC
jgi:hypothetical protein